jgi:excisionase family DNA binding protein
MNNLDQLPMLLRIPEAAAALSVSQLTVRRKIWSGEIRSIRVTPTSIRVPREAIAEYLAKCESGASV